MSKLGRLIESLAFIVFWLVYLVRDSRGNPYAVLLPPIFPFVPIMLKGQREVLPRARSRLKLFECPTHADRQMLFQVLIRREYLPSPNLLSSISPGSAVDIVDAGAHIGCTSLFFATLYPEATIHAIEPSRRNFKLLKRNTRDLSNVRTYQLALAGDSAEATSFRDHLALSHSSSLEGAGEISTDGQISYSVETLRLDEFADREIKGEPYILKMDIEGSEGMVFDSSLETVQSFRCIMLEIHDWMLPLRGNGQRVINGLNNLDAKYEVEGELLKVYR